MKYIKAFARRYSVQYCEQALLSLPECPSSLVVPDNKNEVYYFEESEFKDLIKELVIKHTSSKERFCEFVKEFNSCGEAYVSFCKKINDTSLSKLSNTELKEIYLEYQKTALTYAYFVWAGHLLATHHREKGKSIVKDERMLNPTKKSTVLLMQEKAVSIKTEEEILAFHKEYSWLPCLDIWNAPWSIEAAQEFVNGIKLPPRKEVPIAIDETILMVQELGFIMDARDDYRRRAIFLIQPFFNEIATRFDLTLKQLAFLTTIEINSLLNGEKISFSDSREEGFLLYLANKEIVLVEKDFNKVLGEKGFVFEKKDEVVKGVVAHKGIVTGTVKIVKTVHDILKVEKGDVLVSPMTHPDYVLAMRKACAIVTDEGGLLSHAAIIARELGVPCIVGTKNATKVLEHGSLVEVDADKGIVKML
jgi:phosphohistidine swiveling domain-containing protein